MTILQQLFEFIINRREVKDINYNQSAAIVAILLDTFPIIFAITTINENGYQLDQITINHIPLGLGVLYSVLFTALFYSLFAAQNKQNRFIQGATGFFGASAILTGINIALSMLPGAGLFGIIILGLKISCAVRVMTQSLGYGIPRAILAVIGISMIAMMISTMLFPPEITNTTLIDQ